MVYRRTVLASLLVGALSLLPVSFAASAAQAETSQAASNGDARTFIEGLAEEAIQALTAKDVSRNDRIDRFTVLFSRSFDVDFIGKWVLGRHWRGASDTEKTEYLKLFKEYVVITYVERFDQYTGEQLQVVKAVVDGKDTLVTSQIHRPTGGDPIRVDWRVRAEADVYKIIDVYVEGLSMSQTLRKDFSAVIGSSKEKTVSALNDALRKQIAKLSN